MKKCSTCKLKKELSEFSKDVGAPDRLNYDCRSCCAKAGKKYRSEHPSRREEQRQWRLANPKKVDIYGLRVRLKRYGISFKEYQQRMVDQEGKCAVCGERFDPRQPAIDHCHFTGKIRGLLCSSCNTGLGLFKDSPTLLEKGAAYLRRAT